MIKRLHNVLSNLELKYHMLDSVNEDSIVLVAKSLDAEGVMEVMYIKELADKYSLVTKWDGSNIEIRR
ncbi:hypothetical protein [Sulfurimonas sp. HSL3-7]|uniref:hypothetical protein n=1 Tax=Sulfonitrofixus jiaomeiensis TaxID=3131938 RepID=UPI0031F8D91F